MLLAEKCPPPANPLKASSDSCWLANCFLGCFTACVFQATFASVLKNFLVQVVLLLFDIGGNIFIEGLIDGPVRGFLWIGLFRLLQLSMRIKIRFCAILVS